MKVRIFGFAANVNNLGLALGLLSSALSVSPAAMASDEVFSQAGQPAPLLEPETVAPAVISRSAVQAMVANGATVEEVSEDEAIERAASHGITIKPVAQDSPNYGHPWAIIKAGLGFPSGINLLAEIYVSDNWTIEPGVNVTIGYGAALIGTRWHPDALCWGCKGKVSFTMSPGIEVGHASAGEGMRAGTIITGSGEAELRYRPSKHFLLAAGVRASAGTYIESAGYTLQYTPQGQATGTTSSPPNTYPAPSPPPNPITNPNDFTKVPYPAKPEPFVDALFYIGIGF